MGVKMEEIIKEIYITLYQYMINKDKKGLEDILDDSFVLTHMTGLRQSKGIFIESVLDGTLNYYSAIHENIDVKVKEDKAHLIGDSYVEAAVFGGGKSHWRLRQNINLINRNGKWLINSSKASIY